MRLSAICSIALFFFRNFFSLKIRGLALLLNAIENAIEKSWFNRIIAFYFCSQKFETTVLTIKK